MKNMNKPRVSHCAFSGTELGDDGKTIVITKFPGDISGASDLMRKRVSLEAYRSTLRPAGFRGYNLAKAREKSQGALRVSIAEQLASKGQRLV